MGRSNCLLSSQHPLCWVIVWLSADRNTATFSRTFGHVMQRFRWHHQLCIERTVICHKSFVAQCCPQLCFVCTFALMRENCINESELLTLASHGLWTTGVKDHKDLNADGGELAVQLFSWSMVTISSCVSMIVSMRSTTAASASLNGLCTLTSMRPCKRSCMLAILMCACSRGWILTARIRTLTLYFAVQLASYLARKLSRTCCLTFTFQLLNGTIL